MDACFAVERVGSGRLEHLYRICERATTLRTPFEVRLDIRPLVVRELAIQVRGQYAFGRMVGRLGHRHVVRLVWHA